MSSSPESKTTSQNPSGTGSTPAVPSHAAPIAGSTSAQQASQPTAAPTPAKSAPVQPAAAASTSKTPVPASQSAQKSPTPTSQSAPKTSTPAPATTRVSAVPSAARQSDVQFSTANIGKWAAKQESPFAEQNRRADEKRQRSAKTRRKVLPIVAIVGGIIAIGLIVWGVIMLVRALNAPEKLPEDIAYGSEGATEIQGKAQEIWNQYLSNLNPGNDDQGQNEENPDDSENISQAIEAVSDYFDEQLSLVNNDTQKADLVIIEMDVMNTNNQPEGVISAGSKADPDTMTNYQKGLYYGMLTNAYYNVGNTSEGDRYFDLLTQLPVDGIV